MLDGVEEPDRSPEAELQAKVSRRGNVYLVVNRVRHHGVNRNRIMRRLWHARRLWLDGKQFEAAWQLGYALHYIQDACIGGLNHASDEAEIRRIPIPVHVIEANARPPFISSLERAVAGLRPANPLKALENASAVSAMATVAVFAA